MKADREKAVNDSLELPWDTTLTLKPRNADRLTCREAGLHSAYVSFHCNLGRNIFGESLGLGTMIAVTIERYPSWGGRVEWSVSYRFCCCHGGLRWREDKIVEFADGLTFTQAKTAARRLLSSNWTATEDLDDIHPPAFDPKA